MKEKEIYQQRGLKKVCFCRFFNQVISLPIITSLEMAVLDVLVINESLCMALLILLTYGKCFSLTLAPNTGNIGIVLKLVFSYYQRNNLNPLGPPRLLDGLTKNSTRGSPSVLKLKILGSSRI